MAGLVLKPSVPVLGFSSISSSNTKQVIVYPSPVPIRVQRHTLLSGSFDSNHIKPPKSSPYFSSTHHLYYPVKNRRVIHVSSYSSRGRCRCPKQLFMGTGHFHQPSPRAHQPYASALPGLRPSTPALSRAAPQPCPCPTPQGSAAAVQKLTRTGLWHGSWGFLIWYIYNGSTSQQLGQGME